MTIEFTALDRTYIFADEEALVRHIETFKGNRIYDPAEQAAIRKLDELKNGDGDPELKEIARNLTLYSPGKPARGPSPLDDPISELRQETETLRTDFEKFREGVWQLEREYEQEHRHRTAAAEENPAELHKVRTWFEAREHELTQLREDARWKESAFKRALAQLHALEKRRDHWHADRAARFVVIEDGQRREVDMSGLHEWLSARRHR